MIDLINAHFVPVYLSNEDVRKKGSAPPAAKQEIERILRETHQAKMSAGSVHVYLLDADGKPVGSQHVVTASKVPALTALLEKTIDQLKVAPGTTLVPPAPQSAGPKAQGDDLVLHLVTRSVTRRGDEDVPAMTKLGETRSIGWGAYPTEDWVVLNKADWSHLLPKDSLAVGTSWELNRDVAAKMLLHFYPSSENNDIKKNRIDLQKLRASVVSIKDGVVRARLDGSLRMKHPFYHKDDDKFVDATLLGFLDIDASGSRIRDLQMVTSEATYAGRHFGVAVRMVEAQK